MLYKAEKGDIAIALTGDSLITRRSRVYEEPKFLELVELLRNSDVAVTNAEMLFHRFEDAPFINPGGLYLGADPQIIDELTWMGINLVSTANNHGFDFGEDGLLTHLRNLDESGVVHAGMGRNMSEAREPRYLDTSAGRVALISVTTSGPAALYAGHQWRDGMGRPGANMIRHTCTYTVDEPTFAGLRRMRDAVARVTPVRSGTRRMFRDQSWGMSAIPDSDTEFFMDDLQNEWQYPAPDGYRIQLGDGFSRIHVPVRQDIDENLQRISDARRMADWVVVSIHSHEQGDTLADPSDVVVEFARAAIDAGADIIHGHGPHRDRGIEIYHGKPIFYSIGHFAFQEEATPHVPHENLVRQGLDRWESTPADFYDSRSGENWRGEWRHFTASPESWRDIVAVVSFENKALKEVRLHPIELGFRRPRSQRGRPVLATGEDAIAVLDLFKTMSEPNGTKIEIEGEIGVIRGVAA